MAALNKKAALGVLLDGVIVTAICAAAALAFNALRPGGIPVVQKKAYDILVPCPEKVGEVKSMSPAEFARLDMKKILLIDARESVQFKAWHMTSAMSVPFDYLMPVTDENLRKIAAARAAMVVVYGDGLDPDSGRELGREISGRGIRNVHFIKGGAETIRKQP
jgi:hypothetical protein